MVFIGTPVAMLVLTSHRLSSSGSRSVVIGFIGAGILDIKSYQVQAFFRMKRHATANGIYRDDAGGFWIRPTINGARTWRKLASQNQADAVVEAAAVVADHHRAKLGLARDPFSGDATTFRAVAEAYVEAGCPDRAGRPRAELARRREEIHIHRLMPIFGNLPPAGITQVHARIYGDSRASTPRAADVELATASNVLNWAIQTGRATTNPLRGRTRIQQAGDVRHARDVMPASGDEIHAMARELFASPRSASIGWQLILQAMTGCRTQELLALRMDAPPKTAGAVEGRYLYVRRAKGGRFPFVELHPALTRAIEAHHAWVLSECPETRFWFPGSDGVFPLNRVALTMALNRVCAKLGLPKRTAHGLRAFYVTVHRSRGEQDAQVAARIGDATAALISSTYGNLPEVWAGGEPLDWMPKDGVPAWADPESGHILPFPGTVEQGGTMGAGLSQ